MNTNYKETQQKEAKLTLNVKKKHLYKCFNERGYAGRLLLKTLRNGGANEMNANLAQQLKEIDFRKCRKSFVTFECSKCGKVTKYKKIVDFPKDEIKCECGAFMFKIIFT